MSDLFWSGRISGTDYAGYLREIQADWAKLEAEKEAAA